MATGGDRGGSIGVISGQRPALADVEERSRELRGGE
ncbi:hypothetical protein ACVLV4_001425 [Rathayibacter agropyri]